MAFLLTHHLNLQLKLLDELLVSHQLLIAML